MASESLKWLEDETEGFPEPPTPADPTRGMRRLALAVLLQAAMDFTTAKDLRIWSDAQRFLFPEDAERREYFRWTVEASALNPNWLRDRLVRVRQQFPAPELKTCTHCGPLPIERFYSNGNGRLSSRCKACLVAKSRLLRRSAGARAYRPRPV